MNGVDTAWAVKKAGEWAFDYWDGSCASGYGSYRYDGRWLPIAEDLACSYNLKDGAKILDIGCGKGFLLNDFK